MADLNQAETERPRHSGPALTVAKFAAAVAALLTYTLLALASLAAEVAELREAQARHERSLTDLANAVKALRHRIDERAGGGPVLRGTLLRAGDGKLQFRADGEAKARTISLEQWATVRVDGRAVRPAELRLDRPAPASVSVGEGGKATLVEVSSRPPRSKALAPGEPKGRRWGRVLRGGARNRLTPATINHKGSSRR